MCLLLRISTEPSALLSHDRCRGNARRSRALGARRPGRARRCRRTLDARADAARRAVEACDLSDRQADRKNRGDLVRSDIDPTFLVIEYTYHVAYQQLATRSGRHARHPRNLHSVESSQDMLHGGIGGTPDFGAERRLGQSNRPHHSPPILGF